jgi:peptidyl-prolyl cis-trans isomerase SurA
VKAGDSLKIQEFVQTNKIRQEKGSFEKTEKSVLEKVTWAPGIYSVENNGMYYLVWILDILPPGLKTFEEARASIISDYQAHLEQSWLDGLKKKYAVKVNEKGKRYILENLKI